MVAVAMLFSFKTILAVYAGWLSVLAGIAALPWWFGGVARVMERPSARSPVVLGLAGALLLHSGNLQLCFYAVLFTCLWSSVRLARLVRARQQRAAGVLLAVLALGALAAAGLSAYLLIPLALDARLITRSVTSYEFFLGVQPPSLVNLLTLFHPEVLGTPLDGTLVEAWEHVAFVGGVTLLFALAGAAEWRRKPLVRVLIAGLCLSVFLSIETPLLRTLFDFVPGYALFRLPGRMLFLSAFFICALAGVGLDRILSTVAAQKRRLLAAAIAIALVTVEGAAWARRYLAVTEPMTARISAGYLSLLASGPGASARVATLSRSLPSYGAASQAGLQLVTGYDSYVMRHYQTYLDMVQRDDSSGARPATWTDLVTIKRFDLLAALNVVYVVSPTRLELPVDEYELASSFEEQRQFRFYEGITTGPAYVYRNLRLLPRAFFADHVIAAEGDAGVIKAMQTVDVRESAVVAVPNIGGPSPPLLGDRVEIVRVSAGGLQLSTRNGGRRFLVISEVWHPGWSAVIDGRTTPVVQTNIALLGLWLDPGTHKVELRFWPPGLSTGLAIGGATLVALVLLLIGNAIRPRSSSIAQP